jgi:hypothetical protein
MTNFTDEHVEIFKKGGNRLAHQIWRGKWNESIDPRPKPNDEKLHKFIEETYVKKRWYDSKGDSRETPVVEPITKILKQPEKISFDTEWETPVVKSKPTPSLFDEPVVVSKPKETNFFDEPVPQTKGQNLFGGSSGFDAQFDAPDQFGSQKKKNLSLDDLFGGSQQQQQHQPVQQQQWGQQQQFGAQQQYQPQQQQHYQQYPPQQQHQQYQQPVQQYGQQQQQYQQPQLVQQKQTIQKPQEDSFASLWQSATTTTKPVTQPTKPQQEKSLFDF